MGLEPNAGITLQRLVPACSLTNKRRLSFALRTSLPWRVRLRTELTSLASYSAGAYESRVALFR